MKFRLVKDKLKESVREINHNESRATMKDGTEFNIWTEYDSAGEEQTNCTKIAYIGDNWLDERDRVIRENLLGYLSYSYLRNEKPKTAYVQMIQVKDSMRRKGIATALIDSLKQDFGNNIEYGYTTDDGTKLLKGLGIRESIEEEYDSEGNKLTQKQINFFKNSKVRNNEGKLLVCYHGSKTNFNTFDDKNISNWNLYGKGFYFTTNIERANRYAKSKLFTTYINITNPFTDTKINNEKLINEANIKLDEFEKFIKEEDIDGGYFFKICYYLDHNGRDVSIYLKKLGFDGIISKNWDDLEIVAFYPNQIKAITNKNPSSSKNINEELKKFKTINNDEIELNIESTPKIGAAFITKEGRFINIGNNEHSSIFKIPKEELDYIDISYYFYDLEDNYDLIKLNSGTKYEDYTYIDLWKRPNRNQQQALIE